MITKADFVEVPKGAAYVAPNGASLPGTAEVVFRFFLDGKKYGYIGLFATDGYMGDLSVVELELPSEVARRVASEVGAPVQYRVPTWNTAIPKG